MIVPMDNEHALQISTWTYENEYSIYSFHQDDDTLKELLNGDYFVCFDANGYPLGYFCFGKSAQIPTVEKAVYTPERLDFGLGMKPTLCGKGQGEAFVKMGMNFAQTKFDNKPLRLTVAQFNLRARRVYEKVGFRTSSIVHHLKTQQAFQVMTYTF